MPLKTAEDLGGNLRKRARFLRLVLCCLQQSIFGNTYVKCDFAAQLDWSRGFNGVWIILCQQQKGQRRKDITKDAFPVG